MSIVKSKNKKTGVTYVYESESYWDKEKQQPRAHRRLIGKLDEETGDIIPTGKSGRRDENGEIKVPFKDVIGCRDDIMVNLMKMNVKPSRAFKIMEFVRKGKPSKDPEGWKKIQDELQEVVDENGEPLVVYHTVSGNVVLKG